MELINNEHTISEDKKKTMQVPFTIQKRKPLNQTNCFEELLLSELNHPKP